VGVGLDVVAGVGVRVGVVVGEAVLVVAGVREAAGDGEAVCARVGGAPASSAKQVTQAAIAVR
jgi:hypothetical protein